MPDAESRETLSEWSSEWMCVVDMCATILKDSSASAL